VDINVLRDAAIISQPIDGSEVTEPILNRAIKAGLFILNKYVPLKKLSYVTGGNYFLTPGESFLEAYQLTSFLTPDYSQPATYRMISDIEIMLYSPCYVLTCTSYELDSIPSELEEELINLVGLYIKNYCSNIRRTATLSDLPFDLKGDDFYREFKEELQEIETRLQARETGL